MARERFLAAGHYTPIAEAIAGALPAGPLSVLDSGTGTGYYLGHVLARQPEPHDALAVDASVAAVAMSVAATASSGLVADVWRPSPVRDSRADVVLCVYAPRNAPEFARVLRDDGTLIVVTPEHDHLAELRAAGLVIGMLEGKLEKLDATLEPHFRLADRNALRYTIELDAASASDLTDMGPSAHHARTGEWRGGQVTVSVTCSAYKTRLR